jgi:hypothetical protein
MASPRVPVVAPPLLPLATAVTTAKLMRTCHFCFRIPHFPSGLCFYTLPISTLPHLFDTLTHINTPCCAFVCLPPAHILSLFLFRILFSRTVAYVRRFRLSSNLTDSPQLCRSKRPRRVRLSSRLRSEIKVCSLPHPRCSLSRLFAASARTGKQDLHCMTHTSPIAANMLQSSAWLVQRRSTRRMKRSPRVPPTALRRPRAIQRSVLPPSPSLASMATAILL